MPISLSLNIASYSKRKQILVFLSLCFFFLLLNVTSLFLPLRETLTYDEPYHYVSGAAVLSGKAFERGAADIDARNIMPASALNTLFAKAIRKTIPEKVISQSEKLELEVFWGKPPTILVSLVLAVYIFLWARQLYGINAGFLALTLYVFDPNIIAHSRLVTQDIFGACSVFIATYYYWNFLAFGNQKNAILSMVTFGIAQISRFTAVYLIPIFTFLAIGFYSSTIFRLVQSRRYSVILSTIRQFCMYCFLYLLTAILIINLGFSFEKTFVRLGDYQFESKALKSLQSSSSVLKEMPVPVPYAYLWGLDMGKNKDETGYGSAPSYLMGKLGLENGSLKGFKEYFAITFLYKVPIATQLFLLMALVRLIHRRHQINFWRNKHFCLFLLCSTSCLSVFLPLNLEFDTFLWLFHLFSFFLVK
ncbi:glycosyltransferase family 39 protein [Leptothermofonsia sichuanensis E412]|uniref:glycosyltransferase family 39 protein n=1 Tax=Leptothermofonsia sichuanensis TaxID=2917832 RepID=UPI001CA727F9|nr:glycosyltransferase family 39 protein [Leptothermofonsia sichuanensis]QZZ22093.1 glycosyltransferase family 39 protein [Leptothermofonsia sichuanensis E412]